MTFENFDYKKTLKPTKMVQEIKMKKVPIAIQK